MICTNTSFTELSTITLGWMIEQVAPYLQFSTNLPQTVIEDRMTLITPILKDIAHTQAEAALAPAAHNHESHWAITRAFEYIASSAHLYTPAHTNTLSTTEKKQIEAQTASLAAAAYRASNGWATGPIVDSFTGVMKVLGSVTRTPGQYNKKDAAGNAAGVTNEMIHPCVKYRFDMRPDSWSPALKGFTRNEVTLGGKPQFEWVSADGKVKIPEYVVKQEDGFTRYVASLDDRVGGEKGGVQGSGVAAPGDGAASKYLGGIDRAVGLKTMESEL